MLYYAVKERQKAITEQINSDVLKRHQTLNQKNRDHENQIQVCVKEKDIAGSLLKKKSI